MKLTDGFDLLATAPDGIARLRQWILSLAVQGRLVPQDPTDEPASVLLQKIRAEKDRLIAEGKIRKDKPQLPICDEEKLFELPMGWEWVRFGTIAQTCTGYAFKSTEYTNQGVFVLRVTNIRPDGSIHLDDAKYIDADSAEKNYKNFMLEANDLLLVMVGGSLGKIGIVPKEALPAVLNQNLWKIIHTELTNKKFLFHIINFINATQITVTNSTHGHLSQGEYLTKLIPLPPLAEQSRIVAKVDELMALCDALEQRGRLQDEQHARLTATLFDALTSSESAHALQENWARLAAHFDLILDRPTAVDALEQTILQLAVRGLLVQQDPSDEPASTLLQKIRTEKDRLIAEGKIKKDKPLPPVSDEEQPFALPEGWEWVHLSDLLPDFQNGASSRGDPGGVNTTVLRLADISDGEICLNETRDLPIEGDHIKKYSLQVGDVLITRVNGSADLIGRFTLVTEVLDAIYCDHFIRMRFTDGAINPEYLKAIGNSQLVRNRISSLFITTAGQKTVNQGHISSLLLTLPPLAEQARIVARVEQLSTLCAELRQQLTDARRVQGHLAVALIDEAQA